MGLPANCLVSLCPLLCLSFLLFSLSLLHPHIPSPPLFRLRIFHLLPICHYPGAENTPSIFPVTPASILRKHSRNLACAARSWLKDDVRCSSSSSSCFFTLLSCCADREARSTGRVSWAFLELGSGEREDERRWDKRKVGNWRGEGREAYFAGLFGTSWTFVDLVMGVEGDGGRF